MQAGDKKLLKPSNWWILINDCTQICFNPIKNQHAFKMMHLGFICQEKFFLNVLRMCIHLSSCTHIALQCKRKFVSWLSRFFPWEQEKEESCCNKNSKKCVCGGGRKKEKHKSFVHFSATGSFFLTSEKRERERVKRIS